MRIEWFWQESSSITECFNKMWEWSSETLQIPPHKPQYFWQFSFVVAILQSGRAASHHDSLFSHFCSVEKWYNTSGYWTYRIKVLSCEKMWRMSYTLSFTTFALFAVFWTFFVCKYWGTTVWFGWLAPTLIRSRTDGLQAFW